MLGGQEIDVLPIFSVFCVLFGALFDCVVCIKCLITS